MNEDLGIPTDALLADLQEMARQWRARSNQFVQNTRLSAYPVAPPSPIVQAIEVTSAVADADGYPARIQTFDGTSWIDTFEEVRAVRIGGGVLTTGFYPPGRLMRVANNRHIYGVGDKIGSTGSTTDAIDISGRTGSVVDVTAAQFLRTVVSGTPPATVVTPDDASVSLPGDVNLVAQTLGDGTKTFNKDVIVTGAGTGGPTTISNGIGVTIRGGDPVAIATSPTIRLRSNVGNVSEADIYATHPGTDNYLVSKIWSTGGFPDWALSLRLSANNNAPNNKRLILGNSADDIQTVQPTYSIHNYTSGLVDNGGSATTGGLTFLGGLYISGTITPYTNAQAQDAVGNALLDSARIDLTYNTPANTITADLFANSVTAGFLSATATDVIFGRSTAGAGAGEQIACTAAGRALIDDADAAAQRTTLGLGTGDSPQFTGVNVGHATDTTITRSAAGVIAVEGDIVPTLAASNTWAGTQHFDSATVHYNTFGWHDIDNSHKCTVTFASDLTAARTLTLTTGDASRALTLSGDATISGTNTGDQTVPAAATQAEQEAANSTTVYTSPGRQVYSPSAAKFWIRFNGVGTIAIDASYNVASITDNGVGDYTITLSTAFSSTNYAIVGMANVDRGSYTSTVQIDSDNAPLAGSFRVLTVNDAGAVVDSQVICLAGFGDL